jgi:hypothetical protein
MATQLKFKSGKTPARPNAIKFGLTDYIAIQDLPAAPAVFGHTELIGDWGMLGNDNYGDCVWAGADHETLYWNAAEGTFLTFTDANALADYAAVTGFDPNNPNTDQGTDMEEAAKYRRKTGVVDGFGKRHTVAAYVALPGVNPRATNTADLLPALANASYVFGAVGIGIAFPSTAMDQFNQHKPWDYVPGARIEGGHYVTVVGRNTAGNFQVVTWGRIQEVTPAFLLEYVDEAIVYLSTEFLAGDGFTIDGFDLAKLNADLVSLGGSPVPVPAPTPAPVPTPTPTPSAPPFPLSEVEGWLYSRLFSFAGKRAQKAIKAWLKAGGK